MDLALTEEQEFFRATTRKFLEAESPLTAVRALEADPAGFHPEYWRRGAELGWTSMLVPEDDGGGCLSGEGLLDLQLVAEEMGRLVSPGPLLATNVVAAAVATWGSAAQRAEVLPGLLDGEMVATWAFAEPGARWDAARLGCEVRPAGDGFVLSGIKAPVEAAAQAQHLLVTARSGDGLVQLLVPTEVPGVTVTPMESLDLVKRFAEVRFEEVELPAGALLGAAGQAEEAVQRQLGIALALQCAETAGATDRVLELTLEYVGDRYSFGRPLSSYQALKHRFADMKMWVEASHGTTTAAARAVQREAAEAAELVSAAASYVGSVSIEIIQDCIQLHGGIGVTWEHDIHLYLRRATVNRGMYGSPAEHRERLAMLLGMGCAEPWEADR
jgi:alkylation response protein AidB-like acyl-CoA dehydrogenase